MKIDAGTTLFEVETFLRGLLKGKYSSLSITFNEDHACMYQTAAEYAEDVHLSHSYVDPECWVSEEDRELALKANSVWCLHWYPRSPVGFSKLYASSLPKLLEAVAKEQEQENSRCHANREGECDHPNCPQTRDGEPEATGRYCPLPEQDEEG